MLKMNQALLNKLHDATRQLLANGPVAATAAIQQALGGQSAATPETHPMRDLNPAPPPHRSTPARSAGASAAVDVSATTVPGNTASPAARGADAGLDPAGPSHARQSHPSPRAPASNSSAGAPARTSAGNSAGNSATPAAGASAKAAPNSARHAADQTAAADIPHAAPSPAQEAPGRTPSGIPPFVNHLLARLGALQPGGAMPMPDLANLNGMPDLSGIDLPGIDLPGIDLAGARLPGKRPARTTAPLPPGAQFIDSMYQGATGTRRYKLYVPAGYDGQPLPLVVMLHGCTQDPDDFAAGTRMNALAEEQGFLVAYPAQSQQANPQRCWNWFNALDQQRGQGEPAIIAGIAQQVAADYAVQPKQVYVAGLSAGGAMAVIAGTLYPDVFAAVGVHSGLPYASAKDLPSALQAMKQGAAASGTGGKGSDAGRPIIVFHGDRDQTVHPRNGEQVIEQQLRRHQGVKARHDHGSVPAGRRYTRTTHHHADGTPLGEHWVVHGAGHAWSGGSADGSYTDTRGPDASREMLRFFRTAGA